MVNPTTNNVTYCNPDAVRSLKSIGFFPQEDPIIEQPEKDEQPEPIAKAKPKATKTKK